MTPEDAEAWVDRYIEAWRTYDPTSIGRLFAENATYRYQPSGEPLEGRAAIVTGWLSDQDEPGSWHASYKVSGQLAERTFLITGETSYSDAKTWSNLFITSFNSDHECVDFVEWYMPKPEPQPNT